MKPLRVVLTGSRDWTDRDAIFAALDTLAEAAKVQGVPMIVAHGAAAGADSLADRWVTVRAREGWPVTVERYPAAWSKGRHAGHARNAEMVRLGADVCVTAIKPCSDKKCKRPVRHGSHGATGCADLAAGRDIRLAEVGMSLEEAHARDVEPAELPIGDLHV